MQSWDRTGTFEFLRVWIAGVPMYLSEFHYSLAFFLPLGVPWKSGSWTASIVLGKLTHGLADGCEVGIPA